MGVYDEEVRRELYGVAEEDSDSDEDCSWTEDEDYRDESGDFNHTCNDDQQKEQKGTKGTKGTHSDNKSLGKTILKPIVRVAVHCWRIVVAPLRFLGRSLYDKKRLKCPVCFQQMYRGKEAMKRERRQELIDTDSDVDSDSEFDSEVEPNAVDLTADSCLVSGEAESEDVTSASNALVREGNQLSAGLPPSMMDGEGHTLSGLCSKLVSFDALCIGLAATSLITIAVV